MALSPSRVKRALISLLSTTILAGGLVVLADTPASAAEASYNVIDRDPVTGVTADALPTTQIDGVVWDQVIVGDTVYAGGQFTTARPATAAAGVNTVPRYNLLSYNIRTGVLNTGFAPRVEGGRIRAMAVSPDKSRVYIAGAFTSVNGQTRNRVAAFNTSDGSLVSSFAPNASSDVFSIAVSDTAVYIGGWFGSVNGVVRQRLAAVSPTNGSTLAWAPTADSTVQTMALTPDKSRLIVGGIFGNLNGSPAIGMGSLDATTGTLYRFLANEVIQNQGNTAGIQSLKSDGTNIYGAAYWFGGTGNFEGMFVLDPMSGAIKSMADCHGDTYDVSPANGVAYTVSHHHDCSNMYGFPDTNPRDRWMRANAFTIDATTTTGPNTMGGYYSFQGQPSSSLINWFPDVPSGTFTGQYQGGWTTEATSEYVVQGGEFPSVNGARQQGLVRFAVPALSLNKQGPRATAAESAPSLRGISGNSVRVSWKSNFDRDDQQLTYKLFRSDRPNTPLVTATKIAHFWNRPTQIFTDSGLSVNTTYGYYVTATDATGNTLRSSTTSITTGSTVVDNSAYAQAVQNDGAAHYWRLNEAAGETTSVDWASGNDLMIGSGVANGAAGAINDSPDTAAAFDGTANGVGGASSAEPGPNTFTAEAWFKTTSTSGGKILGFGDSQMGTSSGYDRHVYMDNAGRLNFGVHPGGVRLVTTPGSYNNGEWHHVVATLSSAGQQLYVDGLLESSNQSVTSGQDFTGFWRVGGDNHNGWPNRPASDNLNGTIDDVAIYPTALSVAKIRDHFTKSGRTVDVPPLPADDYGQQVYNDNPSFFWRLNEAGGSSTVADSSPSRMPGNVFGQVNLGAASPVAPGTAAEFAGTNGTLSTSKTFTNPTAYSQEIWFKTTTTNGGKLMGFGDRPNENSGNYDRHIYMENSGQLTFGVWTGFTNTITTPNAYNNGEWHHMVATQDPTSGMRLYVDGALVGTNGQTSNQGYTGYWRVGGDTTWGGNSYYFNGTLDEAAVYPVALTEAQVRAHYTASAAASNAAPVASFTSSCTDATCYLDGSASNDPDGSVTAWAWDFGDDSEVATGSTATHTYASSGTYTVSLTVTDNKGKETTSTQPVTVTVPVANQNPTAAFTSSCTERACAFDSSTSVDPDGSIVTYAWNFGDGNTSALASPTHTYGADGTFTVTLTTTDNRGGSDTVTHDVSVARANVSPTAAFTSTTSNLTASFESQSTDPDGTIVAHSWNFGDDSPAATTPSASHTYAEAGTYEVTLRVTDNDGGTNELTKSVTVTAPANVNPEAAFTSTTTGLKVDVNGSGSSDADGTVDSYSWNWGDATASGSGATASHTYQAAGTYTVVLTVTDNAGGSDSESKSVTVTAPANVNPEAAFTSTTSGLKVDVNGSGSSDADGTVDSYSWNWGDATASGSGATASHTYQAAGTYTVVLTVTDNAGAIDTESKSVTVTAPPAANVVAQDGFGRSGSRWGTADVGGAWTDSGATYFSTSGGKGVLTLPRTSVGPTASLNGVSVLDSTTITEFAVDKVPTGSGLYVMLSARKVGTTEYRLKARLMADGTVRLNTVQVVSGTETLLREVTVPGLTYAAGDVLKLRFDVTGNGTTTLAGKAWKASAAEPAAAQITSTNTVTGLQRAGGVAIQGYLSASSTSAPVTITFDNLLVTRPGGGTPANVAPVAAFTSTTSDLRVNVNGSSSSDADGTIASYAWTYGDGGTGTGATDSHTYSEAGTYSVKLTVTDNSGATATETKSVTVTAPPAGNVAPVAAFTSTTSDLRVNVNGSGSSDADGTIASYAWTYGDGGSGTGATDSHTYAQPGTYSVKLTVTDDDGDTNTATKSVTVTAAPAANIVAQDAFGRTGTRWGTSDVGGTWTDSGATYFSTSGGKGVLTLPRASVGPSATLSGVSVLNSTTTTEFSVDKVANGSGLYVTLVARKQGTSEYRLKARLMADGTVRLNTFVVVNGTETMLREVTAAGLTYAPGDVLKMRFDVSGTGTATLAGKIWKSSASEPASAQISSTNTAAGLQSAGAVGVVGYLSGSSTSAPVTITFDNLLVTRN